jgi:hypothetical protein
MLNGPRLLFYYPFTALTIVFSHVIANPLLSTARNDIALMDVVTGLFGRLDFVSSGLMSCNEYGEFTRLARVTVERAISNHKGHLLDGCHNRNPVDLSLTPHASSPWQRSKDSMTGSSMVLPDAPSGSSNSLSGNSLAGAMPGTDISSVGEMGFSLSSGNRVIEAGEYSADKECPFGSSGHPWDLFTGFDWGNTDGSPNIGPDYFR